MYGAPVAAAATRPTASTSLPRASCSRKRSPAAISARVGARFEVSSPGCVGTTFQQSVSSSSSSSASVRRTIVAVASAGPAPLSWRSDVNGTPLIRAPR